MIVLYLLSKNVIGARSVTSNNSTNNNFDARMPAKNMKSCRTKTAKMATMLINAYTWRNEYWSSSPPCWDQYVNHLWRQKVIRYGTVILTWRCALNLTISTLLPLLCLSRFHIIPRLRRTRLPRPWTNQCNWQCQHDPSPSLLNGGKGRVCYKNEVKEQDCLQ